MKLRGYYFTETDLARLISPTRSREDAIWVPQARTTSFKKCACKDPNALPREVEFGVEPWLARKPEFEPFEIL